MTILKNPPCGFVRAAVLTLGSVWLSGCGQSEAAKIVAVGDGNPKEVAVVIDANRAAEGSAANEAQTTAPIGGATAPPQDSSLTEPTEKEESRSGESAAPSMQGAPPLHSRWGLSVVPHDETPLHVLHDGAISFVGKDLVWLR